jgi:hypothetical protein
MVWKLCDVLEEGLPNLQKLPAKKLKAMYVVCMGLAFGHTRADMVKEVSKLGYSESYAEKFVDRMMKEFRRLGDGIVFRMTAETEPVKGRFGKPRSRRRRGKAGRPPAKYKLEELPKVELSQEFRRKLCLWMLLSGSFLRLLKLSMKIMLEPKMRGALLEAIGRMLPMPFNKLKRAFEEVTIKEEDLEKHIEDWYSKLMEPVWKEVPRILGLELPNEGEP